jgi:hypothetical protein
MPFHNRFCPHRLFLFIYQSCLFLVSGTEQELIHAVDDLHLTAAQVRHVLLTGAAASFDESIDSEWLANFTKFVDLVLGANQNAN